MSTRAQQTETTATPVVFMQVVPRKRTTFHGAYHEDADWIDQYGRVARHNGWTPGQCLQNIYFSLNGTARIWFENHEVSLTSWDTCVTKLKRSFTNRHRRQWAEDLLHTRTQGPNKSANSFAEDVPRQSARADPQATEEKKLRVLMKGVKSDIFGDLARNPPSTVAGFYYNRLAGLPTVLSFASPRLRLGGVGVDNLREVIPEVIREELKKLLPTAEQPASVSLAEIVRDEV